MLLIVNILHHNCELRLQLYGFVVTNRFLEKGVVLDLLNCQAIFWTFMQSYT
jgi:hypothetical protein